jgi:SSS family solute:Na+ symporter
MNFDGDTKALDILGFNNLFPFDDWSTVPFLDRMGWVFLICVAVMFVLGLVLPDEKKGLEIDTSMFKTTTGFAIGAGIVIAAITCLYAYFW